MVDGDKWFGDVPLSPVLESRESVTGVSTRTAFTGRNVTAPRRHATKHPAWCPSLRSFSWRVVPWLRYFILIEQIFQDAQVFKKVFKKVKQKHWSRTINSGGFVIKKENSLDYWLKIRLEEDSNNGRMHY